MNIYNCERWTDKLHKEMLKLTAFFTTLFQSLSCKISVVTMLNIFSQIYEFFNLTKPTEHWNSVSKSLMLLNLAITYVHLNKDNMNLY